MNNEHKRGRRVPVGVAAGVLATVTMDLAMVAAARYGGAAFASERLSPNVIGRWAGGLLRGRWRHQDIMTEPQQPAEVALGIATHYATGIVLTQAYMMMPRRRGGKPSFLGGTAYGLATAVLPLLVLYPSLGFGWFGRRSGETARLIRTMVLGHAAFGLGIGLWAPYLQRRRK